ncbi:MAG: LptF/LptG family permease [Gemmatimonadales bacterium]|jgi:lipopolysaccharide export system permease protein
MRLLDRYLLREWLQIFLLAALGLPLVVILIELAENLDTYLMRDIPLPDILVGYLFSLPDRMVLILPAAVLFATVFSLASMNRHSELTAAKASGQSVHRLVVPALVAALAAAALDLGIAELAPPATRRQLELHGELEQRTTNSRYNFVYRAEEGWVYTVHELNTLQRKMRDVVFEREGTDEGYPTLAVQAREGMYDDSSHAWTIEHGRFRILPGGGRSLLFQFDSLRMRNLREDPADLLIEPKKPEEMRYAELASYIRALERSGGDGRLLRVHLALKLAVPVTCLVIAIFAIPLVATGPRTGGAFGVAVSLVTAIVFMVFVQLSRTIGSGGLVPPMLAAWLPNMVFGTAGVWMFARART